MTRLRFRAADAMNRTLYLHARMPQAGHFRGVYKLVLREHAGFTAGFSTAKTSEEIKPSKLRAG